MLARIINQVKIIEKFIQDNAVATDEQKHEDSVTITIEEQKFPDQLKQPLLSANAVTPDSKFLHQIIGLLQRCYGINKNGLPYATLSVAEAVEIIYLVSRLVSDKIDIKQQPKNDTYLKLLNDIYHWTLLWNYALHADNAEGVQVILPIDQGQDPRTVVGECNGYLNVWAEDMMHYDRYLRQQLKAKTEAKSEEKEENKSEPANNQLAIGKVLGLVPYNQIENMHIPLVPIYWEDKTKTKTKTKTRAKLNHLAPITDQVVDSQFWNKPNFNVTVDPDIEKRIKIYDLLSIQNLADQLVASADENISCVIRSHLGTQFMVGHVIGFIKTSDNCYHFFDANTGWRRFHSAEAFKKWLPFNYHANYPAFLFQYCMMDILSLNETPQTLSNKKEKKEENRYWEGFKKLIFGLISAPVMILMVAIWLTMTLLRLPMVIYDIVTVRKALNKEAEQVKQEYRASQKNKLAALATSSSRCRSYFTDDTWVNTNKCQSDKKKITNDVPTKSRAFIDDDALLPRFFSARKPLEIEAKKNEGNVSQVTNDNSQLASKGYGTFSAN